jgi:hypothetical protein
VFNVRTSVGTPFIAADKVADDPVLAAAFTCISSTSSTLRIDAGGQRGALAQWR